MKHRLSPSGPFLAGNLVPIAYGFGSNEGALALDLAPVEVAAFSASEVKAGDVILASFDVRLQNTGVAGIRRATVNLNIDGAPITSQNLALAVVSEAPLSQRIISFQGVTVASNDSPTFTLTASQDAGTDVEIGAGAAAFTVLALRAISP